MRSILQTLGEHQCAMQTSSYYSEKLKRRCFKAFRKLISERDRRLQGKQRKHYLTRMAFNVLLRNAHRHELETKGKGKRYSTEMSIVALRTRILIIPAFRKWRRITRDHHIRKNLHSERTVLARLRLLTWLMLAAILIHSCLTM